MLFINCVESLKPIMVAESFDETRGDGTSFLLQEVYTIVINRQRRMINNLFIISYLKSIFSLLWLSFRYSAFILFRIFYYRIKERNISLPSIIIIFLRNRVFFTGSPIQKMPAIVNCWRREIRCSASSGK
jgi:hypothetical protein